MKKIVSRRDLLKDSAGLSVAVATLFSSNIFADDRATCSLTPLQGEGPFYPEGDLDRDSDLTQHDEGAPLALGVQILVGGLVQDTLCGPISDALVEIWQACESGRYNHSGDSNPLPLDLNFQYWGRTRTNREGKYLFKTIMPGHYPIGGGRFRPPHIHFKTHARGFLSLTTQSYFDPASYDDPILAAKVNELNNLEGVDRRLMVRYTRTNPDSKLKSGVFNITLRSNR